MVFLKANIPLAKVRILFHITKNKLFFRFLLQNAFCYKTLFVTKRFLLQNAFCHKPKMASR